jgi:hypothetical protein
VILVSPRRSKRLAVAAALILVLLAASACGGSASYAGTYTVPVVFSSPPGVDNVKAESRVTLREDGTWKLVLPSIEPSGLTEHVFSGTYTVADDTATLHTDQGVYDKARLQGNRLTFEAADWLRYEKQ